MSLIPTPQTELRPSPDALAELTARVHDRSFRRVRDLRLTVRDGGLVLLGIADSYYAKQLAQHALLAATELPLRANEILVA